MYIKKLHLMQAGHKVQLVFILCKVNQKLNIET